MSYIVFLDRLARKSVYNRQSIPEFSVSKLDVENEKPQ